MYAVEPANLIHAAASRGAFATLKQSVHVVAAGKAAWPMAAAFDAHAPAARLTIKAGVIAGPRMKDMAIGDTFTPFAASHPSPNAASERAGRRALALAAESRQCGSSLLVLLSGGASSLLAVPATGLSLSDKVETARVLMNAGVAIADLNCVRKHLSAIKGGRLASVASHTMTLAISDVHGPIPDDPAVIGSGPTVADPTTFADALRVIRQARVALPSRVVAHLERGEDETPKPGDARLADAEFDVIANRHTAMAGAADEARRRGFAVVIVDAATSGEARDAGVSFATSALRDPIDQPMCVIASGETTVHVRGDGRGGRNQEFALAAASALSAHDARRVVALASAGTDGIDGPTDAAGAIVDSTTSDRARRAGLSGEAALESNGAYDFFAPLGDVIVWGPTGTNVGDLHVLLTVPTVRS